MKRILAGILAATFAYAFAAPEPDIAELTQETRAATTPLLAKVIDTLKETLATKPPHEAVDTCRDKLPGLVKETREKTGWNIRRVSLKTRNPERGVPDEWESKILADFDRRAAAGEKPETLEVGQVVTTAEGRVFRYMKALPTQGVCLSCHGDAASFSPQLKARLGQFYPEDKATGYQAGQIRGALTVKRLLPPQ